MMEETKSCPLCPAVGLQPIRNFGVCRARKDGRNLYCKKCIRKKVTEQRQSWRAYKKSRLAAVAAREAASPALPFSDFLPGRKGRALAAATKVLSPAERVLREIQDGCHGEDEIRRRAQIPKGDGLGDCLAELWNAGLVKPFGYRRWYLRSVADDLRKAG